MTDKRLQARLEKQLVEIRERPENQKCMDCKEAVRKRDDECWGNCLCYY